MMWMRVVPSVTLLVLLCGNLTALTPLIAGGNWFGTCCAGTAAVLLLGGGIRFFVGPGTLPLVGQLVVLVWCAMYTAAPSTLVANLVPTPQTWQVGVAALQSALADVRENQAPVAASPGLECFLVVLVLLVAITADAALVELQSPLAAWSALLVQHMVPMIVLIAPAPPASFVWLVVSLVVLILVADAVLPGARAGTPGAVMTRIVSAGGITALAAGAGVLAPGLMNSTADDRLVRRTDGPTIMISNPMFNLRDSLNKQSDQEMLRYTTDAVRPAPFRLAVVDSYDGQTFTPATGSINQGNSVQIGLPAPAGVRGVGRLPVVTTEVRIESLSGSTFLPVPDFPRQVQISGDWLWEDSTLNILGSGIKTAQHDVYTVRSVSPEPQPDALAVAARPGPSFNRWRELPADVPPQLVKTAQQLGRGKTMFQAAVALQDHFRSDGGYSYSLNIDNETSSSALEEFMTSRRGYCVHFASTMALMARAVDIPARVVVGYLPGQVLPDGSWVITGKEAHAWPELYFPGSGWVRFEPTPSAHVGGVPSWTDPSNLTSPPTAAPTTAVDTPTLAETTTPPTPGGDDAAPVVPEGQSPARPAQPGNHTTTIDVPMWWWLLVVGVLGVVVVPLVVSRMFVFFRDRRLALGRRRQPGNRAGENSSDHGRGASNSMWWPVLLTGETQESPDMVWRSLLYALADLGVVFGPGSTESEAGAALAAVLDDQGQAACNRLVTAVQQHRYSDSGSEGDSALGEIEGGGPGGRVTATIERQGVSLLADKAEVVRQIRAQTNWWRAWLARLLPGFAAYL